MTAPQTSYVFAPAVALPGMIADMTPRTVDSKLVDVACDAGQGVVTGADGDRVKLPTAAADVTNKFKGVLVYDASKEPRTSSNHFAVKDCAAVLRHGRIWVKTDEQLAVDDDVFLVNGSGAGTAGNFRNDANTAAATQITGAKVIAVASATLALVDFP